LANPAAIKKYTGLKFADDQHDAFWLAEMLRLGILPEGYIYPKKIGNSRPSAKTHAPGETANLTHREPAEHSQPKQRI